ncbi:hypothetical protein GCM10014713_67470 [Streptomyces purpureus]|uniref:HTH cro/C1-type domain-containing protein n=1 Tax=Streptomyces purpureus TaxID=1951 RepID=A0A918LX23_9ACTN|nr:helix-turn-helix transcriptional regulator [Streptomyces purpureus]GGT64984.1 hypothetical protein GCM10014713_67470 [Streptomyces purpureus]
MERPLVFGAELRRRRLAAGLTLARLAQAVHYSKGQLSKVETGRQRPTTELARLCDSVLDADGRLAELAVRAAPPPVAAVPSRREVMAVGATAVLALAPSGPRPELPDTSALPQPGQDLGGTLLETSQSLFTQYRRLGQISPPQAVLPALVAQTASLESLAAGSGPRTGKALLALCARHAEFAGWMAQEAGDDTAALSWTARAVKLAATSGDQDLASYALVRRALVTFYRGDASATVDLARGALVSRLPPRIRGLAAQREAQGHALAGEQDACLRALDQARLLLATSADDAAPGPLLGTTHLVDPVSMVTGWCLLDLGRPRQAAEMLDREVARIPANAVRTHVRYGVRRALAHAVAGDIDHACELTGKLLAGVGAVDSATVRLDLRRLARTLSRHRTHGEVRALAPRLTAALHDLP